MRILIQRVRRASVSVRNELVSRIGAGMLILVGIADEDTVEDIEWLVRKCAGLRIRAHNSNVHSREGEK